MAKKTATGKAPAKPASPPQPTPQGLSPRRAEAAARRAAPPPPPSRPAAGRAPGPRQADTAPVPARVAAPARPVKASTTIKVQARKMGYYGHERRRVGDVFLVERSQFNPSWMVAVNAGAQLQRTTGREELRRKHDEILQMKHADRIPIQTAEHDVEDTGENPLDAD